ncbi:MAG: DUF3795 domain-containing protein [Actinomycetota bacterium]|nr:DUF3795 domain-containing protein [Actinomycetota bacterium]MDD5667490.1 DUF3795 domain-containing protein [Actinomycetota bacterium]
MRFTDKVSLVAPCGMNCRICYAFLRERNRCPGCRGPDAGKPVSCRDCIIKNCITFRGSKARYCFECERVPCDRLKRLDKRYRTKYRMSMLDNLENIKARGIRAFIRLEEERWTCTDCGGTINVHKGCCHDCGGTRS